ncbi:MAG: hypothetical protein WBP16_08055 [Ferruginibacter sp.]
MSRRLLIIGVSLFFTFKIQAQEVSFSVQAHQDDWQLFMSSKIVADLEAGGKVVFITLTAGDAGNGAGGYSPGGPFYLTRENGSVYSSKFVADLTSVTPPSPIPLASTVVVNAHNINKYVYGNTVNYFLRLPDGNGDGGGFPSTGDVSLEKLKANTIPSITAVDNSATYTGWSDLTNTIQAIINIERGVDNQVWMYTANLNTVVNPDDHSDHIYSGVAGQDAVVSMLWVGISEFIDYASATMMGNLSATDHENAAAIFSLTEWGIIEKEYSSNFDEGHKSWLPMDYFTVKRSPVGNAPFAIQGKDNPADDNISTNQKPGLTSIPMIVSITSPATADKDLSMIISPYETGEITTTLYDSDGNKKFDTKTKVVNKEPLLINLAKPFSVKGNYTVVNTLNGKYIETRKITVE